MADEYRCFHSRAPEQQEVAALPLGSVVAGVVACQHVYGVGVYVPESSVWGHVNITALGLELVRPGFLDHPSIGAHLRLEVLGRTNGQLRLAVV